jgi:hypothetical protein
MRHKRTIATVTAAAGVLAGCKATPDDAQGYPEVIRPGYSCQINYEISRGMGVLLLRVVLDTQAQLMDDIESTSVALPVEITTVNSYKGADTHDPDDINKHLFTLPTDIGEFVVAGGIVFADSNATLENIPIDCEAETVDPGVAIEE